MAGKNSGISFSIETAAAFINFSLPVLCVLAVLAGLFYSPGFYFVGAFLFLLTGLNFYYRHLQKEHTLLANFGLFALLRYFLESLGPELRQYLYASDTEERPFNRVERADVYNKSKKIAQSAAFGSQLHFDSSEFKLKHSFYPKEERLAAGESFDLLFGENERRYCLKKPLLISAMSYGSLGYKAIRALARGAKKAGLAMNTGEGGYPKYHLMEDCDLIFQMGTGKFGVRKLNGDLDPERLSKIARLNQVKMIEIKFSQGAKPGKGGILPKEKITEEIAELRNIPSDRDVISPPFHKECRDALSTVRFIRRVQEISSLPVGVKFCLGRETELKEVLLIMKREHIFPDYIALDGSEGGTGASSKTFMDDIGYPLFEALQILQRTLKEKGVKDRIKILASGKLISSGKQLIALGLGADAIYTARGFLLALGCIQALRCHTNHCPTGITTHKSSLLKGLDIEEKSERVKNYALGLLKSNQEMLEALGLSSFRELNEGHVFIPEKRRILA